MAETRDACSVLSQATASAYLLAGITESLAVRFDRVAATYRRIAEGECSSDKTERLLGHVARPGDRAEHERAEALRLRQLVAP